MSESLREEHGPAQTVDKVVSRGAYAVGVGAAYPAVLCGLCGGDPSGGAFARLGNDGAEETLHFGSESAHAFGVEWNIYARCDMSILRRLICRRLGLSRWTGGCAGARLQQQLTLPASSIFI